MSETCGCRVEYKRDLPNTYRGHNEIIYCPLHKAAPEMAEALEQTVAEVTLLQDERRRYRVDSRQVGNRLRQLDETIKQARAVLAHAGKERG